MMQAAEKGSKTPNFKLIAAFSIKKFSAKFRFFATCYKGVKKKFKL
jgi:hypothetical protein